MQERVWPLRSHHHSTNSLLRLRVDLRLRLLLLLLWLRLVLLLLLLLLLLLSSQGCEGVVAAETMVDSRGR